MFVTPLGKSTCVNSLHDSKALAPIVSTVFGIVIFVKELHVKNA